MKKKIYLASLAKIQCLRCLNISSTSSCLHFHLSERSEDDIRHKCPIAIKVVIFFPVLLQLTPGLSVLSLSFKSLKIMFKLVSQKKDEIVVSETDPSFVLGMWCISSGKTIQQNF